MPQKCAGDELRAPGTSGRPDMICVCESTQMSVRQTGHVHGTHGMPGMVAIQMSRCAVACLSVQCFSLTTAPK